MHTGKPKPGDQPHRKWSKAVKERDSYTCQKCGINGVRVDAHHRISWEQDPDLVFDIDNGVTLCSSCHHFAHVETGTYRKTYCGSVKRCEVCNSEFYVQPSQSKRRACSDTCGTILSARAHTKPKAVTSCFRCGKEITIYQSRLRPANFCSRECYVVVKPRACERCGQEFRPKAQQVARGQGRFCSKICMGIAQRDVNNPNYRHGQRTKQHVTPSIS